MKKELLAKNEKIKAEKEKLETIYEDIKGQKRKIAKNLIDEVAFLRVVLSELKETIKKEGAVDIMPQGEYSIKREAPAVQTYNKLIQKYVSLTKELIKLLPAEKSPKDRELDSFEKFIQNRPD